MDYFCETNFLVKMCHETWSLESLKNRLAILADEQEFLRGKIESSFIHAYYLRPRLDANNELAEKILSLIKVRYQMSVMLETYGVEFYGAYV